MPARTISTNKVQWSSQCRRNMCIQCVDPHCGHECHAQGIKGRDEPPRPPYEQERKVAAALKEQPPVEEDAGILEWSADPHVRPKGRILITTTQQTALKRRPGEWGKVLEFDRPTAASSYAAKHKKGDSTLDKEEWELYGKKVNGKSELWARYIGGK